MHVDSMVDYICSRDSSSGEFIDMKKYLLTLSSNSKAVVNERVTHHFPIESPTFETAYKTALAYKSALRGEGFKLVEIEALIRPKADVSAEDA